MVVDRSFRLHVESSAYLASLRALDRSPHTERAYASRVALFLSYCAEHRLEWRRLDVSDLARFLRWLVSEPLPPRGRAPAGLRFRSSKTANAVLTSVVEFLRFGAAQGWVSTDLVARLSHPKQVRYVPDYDPGEQSQFSTVQAKTLKLREAPAELVWLTAEQVDALVAAPIRARDRLLVALLAVTGIRIGEALGLRREDMHLLASGVVSGCSTVGPHIHVRRRRNANGAVAKSRYPRAVPVVNELVGLYAEYQHERFAVPGAESSDLVFVNLYRAPVGEGLRYDSARGLFERLSRQVGFEARPHMLRHAAASRWIEAGVARDVVQELLGHISSVSMEPYLHPTDAAKRAAVEQVESKWTGAAVANPERAQVVSIVHSQKYDWVGWLQRHTREGWRPGEWDQELWLCTGDPDNPDTTASRCMTAACGSVLADRGMCKACASALRASGLSRAEFARTHVRARERSEYGAPPDLCQVTGGGQRCQWPAASRGLCTPHYSRWRVLSRDPSADLEEWLTHLAQQGLPEWAATRPDRQCLVLGCPVPRRGKDLCQLHGTRYKKYGKAVTAAEWARTEPPHLAANQFSLAHVSEQLRWEVLYAVQQRDARGGRLAPQTMREVIRLLQNAPSLATLDPEKVATAATHRRDSSVDAHVHEFARTLRHAHDQMHGAEHTEKMVWDMVTLGLSPEANQFSGIRRRPGMIDFGTIGVAWLREITHQWARVERPEGRVITETVKAARMAAETLRQRADLGEDQAALGRRDMETVVEVFRRLSHPDGSPHSISNRRRYLHRFVDLIDHGRRHGLLTELPPGFNRTSTDLAGLTPPRHETAGKALPDTVIRQLDDNLPRLGAGVTYGSLTTEQAQALFQTAYQILRDTGRRPLEVSSLHLECLTGTNEPVLQWNNHKAGRFNRKLPVTAATAEVIRNWQIVREQIEVPSRSGDYLFPARSEVAQMPHLASTYLSQAIRGWVDGLDRLDGETINEHGDLAPFDRRRVFPYAFRHSYAQRHADAGVPVDVLRDLMDHRHVNTTMGYYEIATTRKRAAIEAVAPLVVDRSGHPAPMENPQTYEARSVAVPFGNCIEPSNVKAGGQACPIRFQCAGCGFYRPDPSYVPAIEEHLNSLRADRETARAMDAATFVVDGLTAQVEAFTTVLETMNQKLGDLPVQERERIDHASAVLRKARAGDRTLLPLHVESSRPPTGTASCKPNNEGDSL